MKIWKAILGIGSLAAVGGILWKSKRAIEKSNKSKERFKDYYTVINQWLQNKNEGKSLINYFKENSYHTIAIYGMGELGTRLYEELKGSDIRVEYFIDKNADEIYYGLDDISVVGLNDIDGQSKVDVIVVTPFYDFDSIEEELLEVNKDSDIVSLEDIIYEI